MKPILIALSLIAFAGCNRPRKAATAQPEPTRSEAKLRTIVYPYSVVPGGVDTSEDVRNAASADTVTAAHYRGIDAATLKPAVLDRDMRAYVSYRKQGAVYWTRNTVLLSKGEKVLTNGRDCIRGRCGNRVSLTPQKPVIGDATREPSSAVFGTPQTSRGTVLDESMPSLPVAGLQLQPPIEFPRLAPPVKKDAAPPAVAGVLPRGPQPWGSGPTPAGIGPGAAPPAVLLPLVTKPPAALPEFGFTPPPMAVYEVVISLTAGPSSTFAGSPGSSAVPLIFVATPGTFARPEPVAQPVFTTSTFLFTPPAPPTGTPIPPPGIEDPPVDGPPPRIDVTPPPGGRPPEKPQYCNTTTTPEVPTVLEPVPEPATALLLGIGLAGIIAVVQRGGKGSGESGAPQRSAPCDNTKL